MKPDTLGHIATAGRNRNAAQELLTLVTSMNVQPPLYEWVSVMAFYSAVHYVNAFLWERHGLAPTSHGQRGSYIATLAPLPSLRLEYRQLSSHAWNARYVHGYRLSERQIRDLLDINLPYVEAMICAELGVSPP